MLSISSRHPDAEDFIDAKLEQGKVTGANVSVKIDDEFMDCALNNKKYKQQYPISSENPKYTKEVDANHIWKKIVHNAWKSAEPGILFWDTIIRESLPDCYSDLGYKTVSTNPCFPASEYLLTYNGYVKFGDLFTTDVTKTNNVICDKRISYVDDGGIEKTENWKINNSETGTIIRNASHVFLTQQDAEIIEIKTVKGFKLRCTLDHHIATTNGMVEAKDLTNNDDILISVPDTDGSIIDKLPLTKLELLSVLIGLVQGDGTTDKRNRIHLDFWGDDAERMLNYVCICIDKLYDIYGDRKNKKNRKLSKYFVIRKKNKIRISSAWLGVIFTENGFNLKNKFQIPEFIFNNSRTNIGKFYIAALMYCDGSLQGSVKSGYSVRLSQSNAEFLTKIQMILHSNGLVFSLYKRRGEKLSELPDGKGGKAKYKTKEQFELISIGGSIVKYMSIIGFLGDTIKENKFNPTHNYQISNSFTDKVVSITKMDNEPVYCLKEDVGRNIIVNGISTRRCGEIPLCPKDSCRLLALNLYSYVENPFTPQARFNFELYKKHVMYAQRIMDDIIDLEDEKIDQILEKIESDPESDDVKLVERNLWLGIREMALNGRRTGTGVTAEGDMLAALGLIYGTKEATEFATTVHKIHATYAYKSSIIMAKERGAFKVFDFEKERNNPFINRIIDSLKEFGEDETVEMLYKTGRRNIALLTLAPTGSTSILSQTTSGIEPVFLPTYKRRRKINPNDKDVKIAFTDEVGDSFEEYNVFHHKFLVWAEINGYNTKELESMKQTDLDEVIKKSPYYKATSNDVDWVEKVRMQGEVQKFIDHSISVTVNLPSTCTEELVSKVYEMGWRSGCKGLTVYRDGSRNGVLVSNDTQTNKVDIFKENNAPVRPKSLKCNVYRFQNKGEKWIGFMGIFDEKPYEIFTGLQDAVNIPTLITTGEIIKAKDSEGNSRYDFKYTDKDGFIQVFSGLSRTFNREYWNIGKLLSGILRHGMPLHNVIQLVDKLDMGDSQSIASWNNGVKRMLKNFIKDGTVVKGNICKDCGGSNLVYIEGCMTCLDCGNSKCG